MKRLFIVLLAIIMLVGVFAGLSSAAEPIGSEMGSITQDSSSVSGNEMHHRLTITKEVTNNGDRTDIYNFDSRDGP